MAKNTEKRIFFEFFRFCTKSVMKIMRILYYIVFKYSERTADMEKNTPTEYSATGTLIVSVYTAGGALPVPDAQVTVSFSEQENSGIRTVVYTDTSGNTPRIPLPAPPAAASETPGSAVPYAKYTITVEKDGFYPRSFSEVPVFANITSVQPVNLIPQAEFSGKDISSAELNTTESQNPNL